MKHFFLSLFLAVLLAGCSKDSSNEGDPTFTLPPETQIGANTFGVTINGKVYIPRDPTGSSWGGPQAKGMRFLGDHTQGENLYNEIVVVDGASTVGFKMIIHIQNLYNLGVGEYLLHQSNFRDQIDSTPHTHIYFKIWDNTIGNYAYYGSLENQGKINVTRFDFMNRIVSGNFKGKFARYGDTADIIEITDGRFDIKWSTLPNTPFP